MAWLRFLSGAFNILGGLFFFVAVGLFLWGTSVGGAVGFHSGDGAILGASMGGVVGTAAAVGNALASLAMFFCGAVLWALRQLLEEAELSRTAGARALDIEPT